MHGYPSLDFFTLCPYLLISYFKIRIYLSWDFPGGPVVKNPPSNARDAGSIPGWGTKIPHAVGQLSPHAATTETKHFRARAPQLEKPGCRNEEPVHCNEDPACCT